MPFRRHFAFDAIFITLRQMLIAMPLFRHYLADTLIRRRH
jgi:hypothetical protein